MYETEEALKTNLEMKYEDDDYPTNSASSDMETDSCEDQFSQSDIVLAYDEDVPGVTARPIPRRGRRGVKIRGRMRRGGGSRSRIKTQGMKM